MFTAREVATVLGLSAGRLRSYLRSGMVAPSRGDDGELRFSFQDLVLLRKAEGLVADRIAPQRVHRALRRLRERLPDGVPLSGVNLAAEGREVLVDDGRVRWQPDSGQVVFDFARPARDDGASVTPLLRARQPPETPANDDGTTLTAHELYERACAVEESSPGEARELYRRALVRDPDYADAHVNLGRLLHEANEVHAALLHYRSALKVRPADATAAFNIGVALEDLGLGTEAIEAYLKAIACDPSSADAHYNVARLLEQAGKPEIAIRHLLIYRQLTRRK
ncbi:MAG TPA: tetratricopeptide repeat protein [Polyangia bacterium]|nr:tetratricopeptide repeat protein [Polyangia bacterium]